MVPGAHADAFGIEDRREIVRVDVREVERDHTRATLDVLRTVDLQPARDERLESLERVFGNRTLVRGDPIHADSFEVFDGRAERDRVRDVARARFEFPRKFVERRVLVSDLANHVAAREERRHRVEQGPFPVKKTDAGRAAHFVAARHEEIDVERAHVDGEMRRGLRAVDQDDRSGRVRARHDVRERRDRAERVGNVRERDELDAAQLLVEVIENVQSFGIDLDEAKFRAGFGCEQLPRYQVRVVFELRGEDRIARPEIREAPREANEVDRLRRVARPNDLGRLRRVDEAGDLFARALEGLGRTFGEFVDAAMDVRVVVRVVVHERIDDGLGLLRRGRGIEIRESLSARRRLREQRKVGGDSGGASVAFGDHTFASTAPGTILFSRTERISSRSDSVGKRETAGSKKPSAIMRSASERSMPRLSA